MTTKSPEQEAREWCNNYAFDGVMYWTLKEYVEGKDIEEYLPLEFAIMAHLAGQAVGDKRGYLRALEEVLGLLEEKLVEATGDFRAALEDTIHELQSKGGA